MRFLQDAQLELERPNPTSREDKISGKLVELWLLKIAFGMWVSGNFARGGEKIPALSGDAWGEYLLQVKPLPKDWGLYILPPVGEFATTDTEFEVISRSDNDGRILALNYKLARMPFSLIMGIPDNPVSFGHQRPSALIMRNDKAIRKLKLIWKGSAKSGPIIYNRVGDAKTRL